MIDMETAKHALENIKSLGTRSLLTLLGIVIGVAAIVSLIALGNSLNSSVAEQFNALGTSTLMVLPGKSFSESAFSKLEEGDAQKIETTRGVDFATEIFLQTKQVELKGEKKTILVVGVDATKIEKLAEAKLIELEEGTPIKEKTFTAILGEGIQEKAFKKPVTTGQTIKIAGKNYKTTGTIKKSSNFFSSIFSSAVLVDKEALKQTVPEKILPNRIFVSLNKDGTANNATERIFDALKKSHGQEDFQILGTQQIAQTASSVIGGIQLVLVAIAAISLLVGGIGVTNAMFTNVMERTKEIGIMKAVGATNSQIMSIFVAEAAIIGFTGGLIGTILGTATALGITIIADNTGFPLSFYLDPFLALFGILFGMTVSIVSGLIPAITAAKMEPVEALKFEN